MDASIGRQYTYEGQRVNKPTTYKQRMADDSFGAVELPIALVESSGGFVAILQRCDFLHVSRTCARGSDIWFGVRTVVKDSATTPTDVEPYNIAQSGTGLVTSAEQYPHLPGHVASAMLLCKRPSILRQ